VINEAIKDRPSDMTITTHVCRGNFRSTWIPRAATGRSPRFCSQGELRRLFLEYDTERAGGFEPLQLRAEGQQQVVLPASLRRIRHLGEEGPTSRSASAEAEKSSRSTSFASRRNCGFASTEEGNVLGEDEQWAKLRMIVELIGTGG